MSPGFWLSHHSEGELDRCYRVGHHFVCARCLGTYPVLFAVFAFELGRRQAVAAPLELVPQVALVLPATLDWAWGRLRAPGRALPVGHLLLPNLWRSATGALLGLGLGRTLAVHVQHPLPPALIAQLAVAGGAVLLVILVGYLRRWAR